MKLTCAMLSILLAGALALAGCGGAQPPAARQPAPAQPEEEIRTEIVPIQIDSVEVDILKSLPAQLQLRVAGVIGDGCHSFDKVTTSRDGTTVNVEITAVRTTGMACIMLAQLYNETILLEGGFEPGTYTIKVNDVTKTVELQ